MGQRSARTPMLPPGTIMTADWVLDAACAHQDPARFVEPDTHVHRHLIERFCENCEVREQCLEEGLHIDVGVWGGTTPRQRRKLRNKLARMPEVDLMAMLEQAS